MNTATLAEALNRYRYSVSILKKGYAQEVFRLEYLSRCFLGSKPIAEITSVDIATYRDQRLAQLNPKTNQPLSPSTVRLEMSLLANVFNIARIEWGLCEHNPVASVRKPKPAKARERRLTPREERQILRYAHGFSNPELYSIIVFALETAARQGEILGLRWEHIDLRERIAHLPDTKNGSSRDLPLSFKARDAILRLGTKPKGSIFTYSARGIKSTWRFMLEKLGIKDLHFHDLRHEAISRLFELNSFDVMEVAAISGHKSLSMLKRYTHLSAKKLVKKLEGNKHKGRHVVVSHMVPYPAVCEVHGQSILVRLLDFDDLEVTGPSIPEAVESAQDALMRRIFALMRTGHRIPPPDQYLAHVAASDVVMIDPMAQDVLQACD